MQGEERFDPEILAEQRPFVAALAKRLVLDENAADDLVQETLLAAMKNPPRSSVRGFLARVVRNLAYRSLRTEARRRRREHRVARPDAQPGADELVARAIALRGVVDELVALDEPYRTVLLMRYFDDLAPKQIAARLDRNPATVRSQLKRGLDLMREQLDEQHGGDRRAWCLPLLPIAFAGSTASAATAVVAGGVAVMTLKKKLSIAAALLVVVLGTTWFVRSDERVGGAERGRAERALDQGVESDRTPEIEADSVRVRSGPTTTLNVEVRNLRGEPVTGAAVALLRAEPAVPWGVAMPPEEGGWRWASQARPTPRPLLVERTDARGRATLQYVPGGRWHVRVSHPEYATHTAYRMTFADPWVIHIGPARLLEGVVRGPDGEPVAAAVVLAGMPSQAGLGGSGPWRARAVADEEGRYRFADLPAEDVALSAGYPGTTARFIALVRTPGPERFDVSLPHGGVVEGKVTAGGQPVAGARVMVRDLSRNFSIGETDASGLYRIAFVAEEKIFEVHAWKSGLALLSPALPMMPETVVSRAKAVRLDLEMVPGAALSGTVRGPDGPIAGVNVGLSHVRNDFGHGHRATVTDEGGRYLFADLPPGWHIATLFSPEYLRPKLPARWWQVLSKPGTPSEFMVELTQGRTASKDWTLVRGRVRLSGTVFGPENEPIKGARVFAGTSWTNSAADGSFQFYVGSEIKEGELTVSATGWTQADPKPRFTGSAVDLQLRLVPAELVRGSVRDPAGRVAHGARIRVGPTMERIVRQHGHADNWYRAQVWPVGADGDFAVPDSGRHGLYLRAEAPGFAPSEPVRRSEPGGEPIELSLRPLHAVTGVVRAAGSPVEGAHVRLRGRLWRKPHQGPDISMAGAVVAITDGEGRFRASCEEGAWRVVVSAPGFAEAIVEADASDKEVEIELAALQTIRGVVVYPDGSPAEGVGVLAWLLDAKGWVVPRQRTQYPRLTDASGSFRIPDRAPGSYRLIVSGWGAANVIPLRSDPVVAGGPPVRLEVQRALSIRGRVVDERGVGMSRIKVRSVTRAPNARRVFAQTRPDGSFELRGLAAGEYDLTVVQEPESGTPMIRREVRAGTEELEIVFRPAAQADVAEHARAVGGIVVDAGGKPVAGAKVSARLQLDGRGRVATSDRNGRFLIERIPPAKYYLRAFKGTASGVVHARTGTLENRIVIKERPRIQGVIRDRSGAPVARVSVSIRFEKHFGRIRTGDDGSFLFPDLPDEGTFVLRTYHPDFAVAVRPSVRVNTVDLVLVLEPGLQASGRLERADGTPLAKVSLRFMPSDPQRQVSAFTDGKGRFVARGMSSGRYEVWAIVDKKMRRCGAIEAGASEVVLQPEE